MNFDHDPRDDDPQDREISLGTATIVGIFLALALVCAAFFGFGYSLGRRSNQVAAGTAPDRKSDSTFSGFKSSSTAPDADASTTPDTQTDAQGDSQPETPVRKQSTNAPTRESPAGRNAAPQEESRKPGAQPAHPVALPISSSHTESAPADPAPLAAGQAIVQVSATSREGDAESLIAALRRKGYNASIRQVPQDKLYHVQLGPYASKKDADAIRQRLDGDGYKAIVK